MTSVSKLPSPPPEPPACTDMAALPERFRTKVEKVLARLVDRGRNPKVLETVRSNERAAWLYGMGRTWDDGRHIVTEAPNALKTWHHYGLAVDLGLRGVESGDEPATFWTDVRECAELEGLTSGSDWNRNGVPDAQEPGRHFCDSPHVQWWCDAMHVTPSDHAAELLASGGLEAVWREVGAL